VAGEGKEVEGSEGSCESFVRPRRKIVGHVAPLAAGAHNVAQAILNTARRQYSRCSASSRRGARYGATKATLFVWHIVRIADLPLVPHGSIVSDNETLEYFFDSKR